MKCSDFLRPSRRASLSFAWRYHAVCPSLRSLRTRHETAGLGLLTRTPLPEVTHGDDSGSPRFLEIPRVPSLCSTTTAGPTRQAIRRSRHGPCFRQQQRLTANSHFSGLHHRALALAVYASPSGLPAADARLASRCWPLCGAGLVTRRIPSKGFKVASLHLIPLSQASWRNDDVTMLVKNAVFYRSRRPWYSPCIWRCDDVS